MKNTSMVIATLVAIIVIVVVVILATRPSKTAQPNPEPSPVGQIDPTDNSGTLCYYYKKDTANGLSDVAWARINVSGMNVTGEYRNIPAEKDSKSGTFTGVVASENAAQGTKTANLSYMSMAEGMTNKEELDMVFGSDSAYALYGEMAEKADGSYGYKDRARLTPGVVMPNVTCAFLESNV